MHGKVQSRIAVPESLVIEVNNPMVTNTSRKSNHLGGSLEYYSPAFSRGREEAPAFPPGGWCPLRYHQQEAASAS